MKYQPQPAFTIKPKTLGVSYNAQVHHQYLVVDVHASPSNLSSTRHTPNRTDLLPKHMRISRQKIKNILDIAIGPISLSTANIPTPSTFTSYFYILLHTPDNTASSKDDRWQTSTTNFESPLSYEDLQVCCDVEAAHSSDREIMEAEDDTQPTFDSVRSNTRLSINP
jgi:hypothetical protein